MLTKCEVCGKEASSKCSACGRVFYCSKEHQKLHWKQHKASCSAIEVKKDAVLGRYVVADRDIKAGEVIIKEKPLLTGPIQNTGPVCLGCYVPVTKETSIPCPNCGWPLCSLQCASKVDHRPECHWTTVKRKSKVQITQFITPHPTYGSIMALRFCYMKSFCPDIWAKLISLESHDEQRKNTEKYEADRFGIASFLKRFYNLNEFTEEEILKVCGILQINGHEVPLSDLGYVSVYWKGSMLEHNCRANCSKSFNSNGELIIRAMENIKKGDHVSICYTDPMWATHARSIHLLHTKFFSCKCPRCSDPTELGSYMSAVLCLESGCQGYVIPSSKNWKCIQCGAEKPEASIAEIQAKVATLLSGVDKHDVAACKKFFKDVERLIPSCNYAVREVQLSLAQLYGQLTRGLHSLTPADLAHKEFLCRDLIQMADSLTPGECRIRGVLYFELHATVAERARRASEDGLIDPSELTSMLMESKTYLEKTREILKYEPDVLPEGKIAKQAEINYRDLENVLKSIHLSVGDSP